MTSSKILLFGSALVVSSAILYFTFLRKKKCSRRSDQVIKALKEKSKNNLQDQQLINSHEECNKLQSHPGSVSDNLNVKDKDDIEPSRQPSTLPANSHSKPPTQITPTQITENDNPTKDVSPEKPNTLSAEFINDDLQTNEHCNLPPLIQVDNKTVKSSPPPLRTVSPSSNQLQTPPPQHATTDLNAAHAVSSTIMDKVKDNEISGAYVSVEDMIRTTVKGSMKYEKEVKESQLSREYVEQLFNIPSAAVGKIIGREGKTIKRLQRETGARLKFSPSRDKSRPFQTLLISGNLQQIANAVNELLGLLPSNSICHDLLNWTIEKAISGKLRPIDLPENTTFVGRLTHVTSPQDMWVQVCRCPNGSDYTVQFSNLTENMTNSLARKNALGSMLLADEDILVGAPCAVMLEGRCWRAVVLVPGNHDNPVHVVRLVDFGTTESFTELYKLDLAHVSLRDGDVVWPSEAAEYLEVTLRNGFVKVKVAAVTEGQDCKPPYSVEMFFENEDKKSICVNRELLLEGYSGYKETATGS